MQKLFCVGPVEMDREILQYGEGALPYFRTEEFSALNLEIERGLKELVYTKETSKVALLTASGSGAMEAAVVNLFDAKDKVLIVAGGGFGERFVQLCVMYGIAHTVIRLNQGQALLPEHLEAYKNQGYTGLLLNAHETSTGVYYDLKMAGEFCRREKLVFVVDAISSFLADPYFMDEWHVDLTIISSQKGLALPPGLSVIVANEGCAERIAAMPVKSFYFDLNQYFINMERGQTPFTPAVGILLQLHARVKQILEQGVATVIHHTHEMADDFRRQLQGMPLSIPSESLSNALTPLRPTGKHTAWEIFLRLKEEHGLIVCPSGGACKDTLFRVGHIGCLTKADHDLLIEALRAL